MELEKAITSCNRKGCSWRGSSKDYLEHIRSCKFAIVSCSYKILGYPEKMARSDAPIHEMRKHMKMEEDKQVYRTSMQQPMPCDFRDDGCQFMGHTKELEEHYATNMKKHLQLTNNSLKQIEKTMGCKLMVLSQQISDLKSEINHEHREIPEQMQPVVAAVNKAAIQSRVHEEFSDQAMIDVQSMVQEQMKLYEECDSDFPLGSGSFWSQAIEQEESVLYQGKNELVLNKSITRPSEISVSCCCMLSKKN